MAGIFDPGIFDSGIFDTPSAGTSASAGVATGTGAAQNASIQVSPAIVVATGTGAAQNAAINASPAADVATGTGTASGTSVSTAPVVGVASGTGAANDATAATGTLVSANAEAALGTGSAANATDAVAATASVAAGTGTAANVSTSSQSASEAAAGTGAAQGGSVSIQPKASVAAGAGAASTPRGSAGVSPGVAAGTGSAADSKIVVLAQAATGTGTAYAPLRFISSTTAITAIGVASGGAGSVYANGTGLPASTRPGSASTTNIVIRVNGVDITGDVDIATARFSAVVNGATGTATLKVRDDGHVYRFTSGGSLTLDIAGVRMWGGYVTSASRVYPFPVENTSIQTTAPRYWQIGGVDYNVLFNKRIIFDPVNPTTKLSWDYAVGTYDNVIINDLFDNYLTIATDGLSRSGVTAVAVVTLDIKGITSGKGSLTKGRGQIASPGYTWKQAMDVIARATGAIYYIDPNKVLHYVDVDTPTASYVLSDQPAAGEKGYQNFQLLYNGTNLLNDMLVWGSALGSDRIVFARNQSTTSQTDHGRWQGGMVTSGLYQQASANLVAASFINGTPQNKRGGKDDAISLTCRVFEPAFNVGQKVTTEVNTFGYTDVLPVRRQEISFINPSKAVFDLTLSHDVDQNWSIYEELFARMPDYNIKIPDININIKPPVFDPPLGGCTDAICGITDTFTRTTTTDPGTSDSGKIWGSFSTVPKPYCNGTQLVVQYGKNALFDFGGPGSNEADFKFQFYMSAALKMVVVGGANGSTLVIQSWNGLVYIAHADAGPLVENSLTTTIFTSTWYNVRLQVDSTSIRVKLWQDGNPEPASWLLVITGTAVINSPNNISFSNTTNAVNSSQVNLLIDNLDVTGVNRCTEYRFDNFNRTTSGSLGTSSDGHAWSVATTLTSGSIACNGSEAVRTHSAAYPSYSRISYKVVGPGPWTAAGGWTMTGRFKLGAVTTGFAGVGITHYIVRTSIQAYLDMYANNTNGYIGTSGSTVSKTDWVAGVWYLVKWELLPQVGAVVGSIRMKLWKETDAEPATWATDDTWGGSLASGDEYWFDGSSSLVTNETWDYINFDYAGKPCYCSDTSTLLDDFNRSVSTPSWGTSSSGAAWTTGLSGNNVSHSVDGSSGVMVLQNNGYLEKILAATIGSRFIVEYDFLTTVLPTDYSQFFVRADSRTAGLFWNGSGASFARLDTTDVAFSISAGTIYHLKWEWLEGSTSRLKVWAGSTEPSSWTVTVAASVITPTDLLVRGDWAVFPSANGTYKLDNLRLTNTCSNNVFPASGSTFGYICEVPTRVTSTTYQLTSAISPGTTEVTVNGVLQRPGIAREYTAGTTNGLITFNSPVTSTDVVQVCYMANGPVI